ncbi:MAG TPA: radical SAM protein [Gaiellaceae bacterium]|nr:radical SAM protein [Gaiellaceae bacterium]
MTEAALARAVEEGRCGERLWLYATYHCNLACIYCLTESYPGIARRRAVPRKLLVGLAQDARELGFGSLGVTGGEVFMLPDMPETLVDLGSTLPTVALTNGTLFTDRLLARMEPLASVDVVLQVSLDSPDPVRNDMLRGPENYAKVAEAIPELVERGIAVRIATTVDDQSEEELARLCDLHRSWGISDDDHVVRGIVRRGRAAIEGMGVEPGPTDILPELTITADGAFLHPFAPTVRNGVTDLDLLVSRQVSPLEAAARRFLGVVADQPVGTDVAATFT